MCGHDLCMNLDLLAPCLAPRYRGAKKAWC
nr:MAG TPA: hypothetical protein [Caudoviricetes sp.]